MTEYKQCVLERLFLKSKDGQRSAKKPTNCRKIQNNDLECKIEGPCVRDEAKNQLNSVLFL